MKDASACVVAKLLTGEGCGSELHAADYIGRHHGAIRAA